jgi:hypothetical protein
MCTSWGKEGEAVEKEERKARVFSMGATPNMASSFHFEIRNYTLIDFELFQKFIIRIFVLHLSIPNFFFGCANRFKQRRLKRSFGAFN